MEEMGDIGKMNVIMNVAIDNILGIRTPTRTGGEKMSKLKYETCMLQM